MPDEEKAKLNRHDQIIEGLAEQSKTLFNITSKLNGEYAKMDKEGSEYRISFSKDLDFIKNEIKKGNDDNKEIKNKLDTVIDGYVKREEFEARFRRLQEEIDGRITGANTRIDDKTDTDKFDEAYDNIQQTLNELKDNQKWVTRIIIGGVLMTLLGTIFIK